MTIPEAIQIALQHHRAGRLADAEALYRQILAVQPNHAETLHRLGVIAHHTGRNDLAADMMRQAICSDPADAAAHSNLGEICRLMGRLEEAIAAFHRAIELMPNLPGTHNNLGNALREQSRLDEAIVAYRRAIELNPAYAKAYINLGNTLRERGQLHEAIAACRRAIQLQPDSPEAHNNLGNALKDQGEVSEAIASYRQALALKPDYAEIHSNLGNALREIGQLDEAVAAFRRAAQIKPDFPMALANLGNGLKEQGELDEAIASFRRVVLCAPENASVHSALIHTLHFHPAHGAATISAEHQRWDQRFGAPLKPLPPYTNDRTPGRRLRIGYVSPDFREHAVARFALPLFEQHDRAQFEVLCYSGVTRPDAITDRFRALAGQWRNTLGISDEQLAGIIREDKVDILVDLAMHTSGNRLTMFVRQPAPVQVSWLGYPGSAGMRSIGYRLTDPRIDPTESRSHGAAWPTEKPVRLPDSWCCYQPTRESPEVNSLPAFSAKVVTFGSLNNFSKIHEGVLNRWAQILIAIKASRLLIYCPSGRRRERVQVFLAARGIDPERIEFIGFTPALDYLRLYHRIDIALDPFPCNGMTTTCDALWMGAPILTFPGEIPASRAGLSLMSSVGLGELVASSEEDYVKTAVEWAGNLPRLAELRATLRQRMQASPLLDAPRFARNVEAAYRSMWQDWVGLNT